MTGICIKNPKYGESLKPIKMSMTSTFLIILTFLYFTTLTQAQRNFIKLPNVKNFDDYLKQTGKVYTTEQEREYRESIFLITKALVDLGNKYADLGLSSYKMTLNSLADSTHKETGKLRGSKITFSGEEITAKHVNYVTAKTNIQNLPGRFDWRELGGVTPAAFQGAECGSCWSFATIGALEGHLFRRTGLLVPLSQQNLVDCADAYGCMGCDGGYQEYGFEYIRDHGVSLYDKYPYIEIEHTNCGRNDTYDKGVFIRDYARIKPGDEEKMKEVIATLGPLACSMNADVKTFEQYSGGIFEDETCNKGDVNHAIVVVGYGSENGRDYWIIKNSYSAKWGENGFMKLPRNENSFCGIATECSYPIL